VAVQPGGNSRHFCAHFKWRWARFRPRINSKSDSKPERARDAGVADRIVFEVAMAKTYPERDYDFVTFFDCLHDMGDPAGASAHVHSSLRKDGTWMIVEPFAGDKIEDNLNPIGRAFYGASTLS
jgi:hypothetical protein